MGVYNENVSCDEIGRIYFVTLIGLKDLRKKMVMILGFNPILALHYCDTKPIPKSNIGVPKFTLKQPLIVQMVRGYKDCFCKFQKLPKKTLYSLLGEKRSGA